MYVKVIVGIVFGALRLFPRPLTMLGTGERSLVGALRKTKSYP